jgi:hypothetical protein
MNGKESFALGLVVAAGMLGCSSEAKSGSSGVDAMAPPDAEDWGRADARSGDESSLDATRGCVATVSDHGLAELFKGSEPVLSLQVAGEVLYFSDTRGVWSMPVSGGTRTQVASVTAGPDPTFPSQMGAFVVTQTNVVWADKTANSFAPTLHVKSVAGGAIADLKSGTLSLALLSSLAATPDAVVPMAINASSLIAIRLDGAAPVTLASNTDLSGVLVWGPDIYFSNSFSGRPANKLLRVPASGGNVQELADLGDPGGGPMKTDGYSVFMAVNLNQQYSLLAWPLSSGAAVSTLFNSDSDTSIFAGANGRVYFTQQNACADAATGAYSVWEIGADKSNLHADAAGLERPLAITADASYVYIATQETGLGAIHIRRFAQ